MQVTLESPLQKRHYDEKTPPGKDYWHILEGLLRDKNCIIIATADVNDLTEYSLCHIFRGQAGRPLTPFKTMGEDEAFRGYITLKKQAVNTVGSGQDKGTDEDPACEHRDHHLQVNPRPNAAFFTHEEFKHDGQGSELASKPRGFIIRTGLADKRSIEYTRNQQPTPESPIATHLGQLVVARNPFASENASARRKWIVIISGTSGQATLGIAQMLTGCIYDEFTVNEWPAQADATDGHRSIVQERREYYEQQVTRHEGESLYDALSEGMVKELVAVQGKDEDKLGLNAIVAVDVYHPQVSQGPPPIDQRKIIGWEFPRDLPGRSGWANPNTLWLKISADPLR